MKKILIAFLMSIISLGSITTPTFADGCQADDDNCKKILTSDEIDALQAQVDASRANERTLEHRINDTVGIGGVGIGGMMIGGALSERAADDYAESDMAAYINNTFMCDYGDGNTVRGGQTNVEIPGGNELIDLYARYARLANDLKLRKESLGIKPGIESEVIIDKASTGLYDDVGTGVVGGGYASIARAIMNPNGPDAAMWAAQRAATTSKLNTGIGIATTAAALTLANTFKDALKKIEQEAAEKPVPCPSGSTGDSFPNCTCDKSQNLYFDKIGMTCATCDRGREIKDNNTCDCPDGTGMSSQTNKCEPFRCEPQCNLTKHPLLRVRDAISDCNCTCENAFEYNETTQTCECPATDKNGNTRQIKNHDDGTQWCAIIEKQVENVTEIKFERQTTVINNDTDADLDDIVLSANGLFDNDQDILLDTADLDKYIQQIIENRETQNNYSLIVYGHADPTGTKDHNDKLSQRRADNVAKYIEEKLEPYNNLLKNIKAEGKGYAECYKCKPGTGKAYGTPCDMDKTDANRVPKGAYADCRRIEIGGTYKKTTKNRSSQTFSSQE